MKRNIVNGALEQFKAEGAENLSLRRLSERISMSHTIIYRYFRDKKSLLEALQLEMLGVLQRMMEEADEVNAHPIDRLRLAATSLFAFANHYPEYYRFLFFTTAGPSIAPAVVKARHEAFDFVVDIAELASTLGATEMEPRTLANLSWAMLHGLIMLELGDQLSEGREPQELLEAALNMLFGPARPPQ